jgi:hypothetical protein
MHNALSSRHKLQITSPNSSLVTREIFMVNTSAQQIRDGFLSTVRMIGYETNIRNLLSAYR